MGLESLQSLCLGVFCGFPWIAWGLILIFDRDRTWRRQDDRLGKRGIRRQRTESWDRRQIIMGTLLTLAGVILTLVLIWITYVSQSV